MNFDDRTEILITPEANTPTSIPSVALDEMALAMALFVGAANGRIVRTISENPNFLIGNARTELSGAALDALKGALADTEAFASDDIPLACALAVVWHHYEGDQLQQTVCARLIAFYSLIVRNGGSVFSHRGPLLSGDPESLVLEPSTLRAVATAPLNAAAQFEDASFEEIVAKVEDGHGAAPTLQGIDKDDVAPEGAKVQARLALTRIVRELAKRLYIYETCAISPMEWREAPQFRVLHRFCESFTTITGSRGLQLLLSRALAATRSEFPWLGNIDISSHGGFKGIKTSDHPPSLPDALQGELAIIGALVELLRSLLGDDVTIHLLQTIWPLALLSHGSPDCSAPVCLFRERA